MILLFVNCHGHEFAAGSVAVVSDGSHAEHVSSLFRPGLMEALNPREDESHGSTRKYPEELRERAVRLAVEARRDPITRAGALRRIGEQLGINP